MNIKKHIPNFLTCCNLLCGCLGIIIVLQKPESIEWASYLVFLACLFDFLDGFVARLLNVQSPIGKELDSLADVTTFGVLPGMIIFHLFNPPGFNNCFSSENTPLSFSIEYISLLIPVFSALRLAKFNIDTRQSESFIGVPTPANGLLIASLPLILIQSPFMMDIFLNSYFLIALSIIMSYLLVAELPLFALKFKHFKWAGNEIRFIFLGLSLVLIIALKWLGIPIIIFLYIILSVVDNLIIKKGAKS